MGVSKVDYNGETLIDLSNDSVTRDTLAFGETAHNSNGDLITGRMIPSSGDAVQEIEWVTCTFDLSTMSITYFSHSQEQIEQAYNAGKVIKVSTTTITGVLNGLPVYLTVIGNLTQHMSAGTNRRFEFQTYFKADLGDGEYLYLLEFIYVNESLIRKVSVVRTSDVQLP